MIISISGKKGSGKDLIGQIIKALLYKPGSNFKLDIKEQIQGSLYLNHDWKIKKFADKLKDIVCLLLNCTREQLEHREFKEKELGKEWWYFATTVNHNMIPYIGNEEKYTNKFPIYKLTPRRLLQLLGTECGRKIIHPNIWVNSLMSEYYYIEKFNRVPKYPNWVITDMRFPNELKAVKDRGGITVRVNRPCKECGVLEGHKMVVHKNPPSEHESETALDGAQFDYTISNNGTIEELIKKIKQILIKEKII